MIRMTQSKSSGQAKSYFSDGLQKADYYIKDQELQGWISGKLADRLGLTGPATREVFFALCDNKNPKTGKPLTPHTKANRTTGYDLTFLPPKSVSIAALLEPGDGRIIKAFEQSVADTLKDVELDSCTRVRKGKKYDDRKTGELIIAGFTHLTSRPTEDQAPDPFLHHHAYLFNCTYDSTEQKIKAGKFRDIMTNVPYYNALFTKRLADNLVKLGYDIRHEGHSFELASVSDDVIRLFSKRRSDILRVAKEQGITDKKGMNALGAKTRANKQKGLSMAQLKEDWKKQLQVFKENSGTIDDPIGNVVISNNQVVNCSTIIDQAILQCFERASVVSERNLLQEACRFAIGHANVGMEELKSGLSQDGRIVRIKQGNEILCTTKDVLTEEREMVELAKESLGKVQPLSLDINPETSDQQERAINQVLSTTNRISIIRGAAGSGKTTLMKKAIGLIEETGKKVTVVAPTASASRGVLKSEGHKNADTVARLLADKAMQSELKNGILWVDEAGLLGTETMLDLLRLTKQQNARLILSGDDKQHSSVIRGDALRVLKKVARIPTAEINVIRRQKNELYKAAVEDLANANVASGFEKLDRMGAIKVFEPDRNYAEIATRYIEGVKAGRSTLIISPTHMTGEDVTASVRQLLKDNSIIGTKETTLSQYINRNLTVADKSLAHNYQKGQAVQFNRPVNKVRRGSLWIVSDNDGKNVTLVNKEGETRPLPLDLSERFDVFDVKSIQLAKGDKIRVTRNSYDKTDVSKIHRTGRKAKTTIDSKQVVKPPTRMDNGLALEVISIKKSGKVTVRNPVSKTTYNIDREFGHITHDYCVTSHASQGKTCDEVIVVQPSSTFGATNAKQFYVSVSRAKHNVSIYTDDREALLNHAQKLGDRLSATELFENHNNELNLVFGRQKKERAQEHESRIRKENSINRQKVKGYEPSL